VTRARPHAHSTDRNHPRLRLPHRLRPGSKGRHPKIQSKKLHVVVSEKDLCQSGFRIYDFKIGLSSTWPVSLRSHSVGAHGLDVAGLLALVAHALAAGLGWAVAREMADLAA